MFQASTSKGLVPLHCRERAQPRETVVTEIGSHDNLEANHVGKLHMIPELTFLSLESK